MANVFHIAKRELNSYFGSPIAYVITAAYLFVCGLLFYLLLMYTQKVTLDNLQFWMVWLLLLLSPVLTMRLIAEEQRTGTIEVLLTMPVRDWEVVIGKYLAAFAFEIFMIVPTLYYLFLLTRIGKPDVPASLVGYLTVLLIGSTALAIGTFASSLTQNQIVSAFLGLAITLIFWFSSAVGDMAPGVLGEVFKYIALPNHYSDMVKGVLDTSHIVYFLSMIVIFLFLTVKNMEARRYR